MDYKYLILRYQTFRDQYLELTHKWFRSGWSWVWRFTLDNFRFLYRGEINQIRMLTYTLRQQDEYIRQLESGHTPPVAHPETPDDEYSYQSVRWLRTLVYILLLPTSFLIYWIRRTSRIIFNRRVKLLVFPHPPVDDKFAESSLTSTGNVYLVPENKQAFPRGLVIFRYTLVLPEELADSILFINPGHGFVSEYSIPLPFSTSGEHESLIELPPDITLLKLQATSQSVTFTIRDISMTEICLLQAARYLKARHDFSTDDVLNTLFICKLPGVRRVLAHKIPYAEWHYKYVRLSSLDIRAIRTHISTMKTSPLVSVIINASNNLPHYLDMTLQSVQSQLYPHWELLIVCAEHPDAHITTILNRYERYDKRIRIVISRSSSGISTHTVDAIGQATGIVAGILGQGDMLTEHALYMVANTLQSNPQAALLYSDHDHIDEHGRLLAPCLKPDWNLDFLLGKDYLQPFVFYRLEDLRIIATESTSVVTYDLDLRMIERINPQQIVHIPYLLLHKRKFLTESAIIPAVNNENKAALEAYLQRGGQTAMVTPVAAGFRIERSIPEPPPLVSLVVLTRDRVALLSNCVNGLLEKTAWPNLELIIIDNGTVEASALAYIEAISGDPRVRVFRRPGDFNFSELNNFGVEQAKGEYLGLLNNDISVINPDWLTEMVSHLQRPEVGIVGAKLLYENETVQHAGVIIGLGGVAGHGLRHAPRNYPGYDDRLVLCQQLSCVTAACLLTKKSVYQAVGGLDDINLRIAFNDVDYCLKVREQGWKIIWTPFAELYHLESASRGFDLSKENINRWKAEYNFMRNKWRDVLEYDPFYNLNLSIADEEFALAQPPRLVHPWEQYRYYKQSVSQQTNGPL